MNGHPDAFSDFAKRITQTQEKLLQASSKKDVPTTTSGLGKGTSMTGSRGVAMLPVDAEPLMPVPELFPFPEMDYQLMQGYNMDLSVDQMLNDWF